MNKLNDDHYWYDKATDTVIQCNKTQYREFLKKNNGRPDAIKYDKFTLTSDAYMSLGWSKEYVVSTVCLTFCYWDNSDAERYSDRPLIFETMVFENNSVLETNLNYCINEAKNGHDYMILKIIREIQKKNPV